MASHKSAKKRIRTTERRKTINKNNESKIKTLVKKTLNSANKEEAEKAYKEAVSVLDKSITKGVIHRNNAARKKAALTKYVNNLAPENKK
ncbi:MAG: 30S ribosomal protein S20 [Ignavibacteriaceae bacterium]